MPSPVAELLADSGPIAAELTRAFGGFEIRPQQIEMATAVARAMENGERLIVEAGTGVGKSFAYLLPAILRATQKGEKVVIATATIALQEQLIGKDIPLLVKALGLGEKSDGVTKSRSDEVQGKDSVSSASTPSHPHSLRPVLAKGRGNYMSIRRLQMASARGLQLLHDEEQRRTLYAIEDWAAGTLDGSLATAPALDRPEVWDHVRSDADNCMGRKCPQFKHCFYQKARRELESANLIVCNHALFFSDLALRSRGVGSPGAGAAILPNYDHVILDEAHNVEDAACDHFGLSLTQARVMRLLRTLYSHRRRKGFLMERALAAGDSLIVDKALTLVQQAEHAGQELFDTLLEWHKRNRSGSGRLRKPAMELGIANPLSPAMSELAVCLRRLRDSIESDEDRFELASFARRAAEIADSAEAMLEQTLGQPGDYVYWVDVEGGGGGGGDDGDAGFGGGAHGRRFTRVTLGCAPVDVSKVLRQCLFEVKAEVGSGKSEVGRGKGETDAGEDGPDSEIQPAKTSVSPRSIVLTSATLATRTVREDEHPERAETAFAHLINNLGIDSPGPRTLQLGSPFDYARQAKVVIDLSVPDPKAEVGSGKSEGAGGSAGQAPRFTEVLAERVFHHALSTRGGAFVLFTSFASMNAVADRLRERFAEEGLALLVQGRDGPRTMMLQKFLEHDGAAVLFGAASFWQGVDVRGERLRNVIITRLPFEPPDRPLTQARLEKIEGAGGNPFMQDSLPRAIIRFKQGFGRLIRSSTDTGRVVILDPRVRTARYGKMFMDALPREVGVEVVRE